ncbi:hypothetical protein [Streptomyces zagrosensis]|uniref:Uncharacterized protein n=1 Tax=Streptomyces zagrosensis TaxID=1042984 RepID=A0A7W9UXV8_9ACTN|nr:hypothetical protein [Streptomyces zagrosensis]MBB5934741.1 hypothetical protein [Streptomyces zagrosensis]
MRRHTFEPGRLVAGVAALAVGAGYALDAAEKWNPPPFVLLPVLAAGLVLAALITAVTHAVRRRTRRAEQARASAPDPSTLGDLPMDWFREGHEALRTAPAAPAAPAGPTDSAGPNDPAGPTAGGRT